MIAAGTGSLIAALTNGKPGGAGSVAEAVALAEEGDQVFLGELPASTLVETAETLLQRGVTVILDATRLAALGRSLGRDVEGHRCVVLSPHPISKLGARFSRSRDILVASLALIVLAPVIGVLALLVRLTSNGPAFHEAEYIGRNGRVFTLRKLRTMRIASDVVQIRRRELYQAFVAGTLRPQSGNGAPWKIVDPSRITWLGRFLRRHSLDELPQFWNVLRGDMTLVGPRPCLPYEYELQAPWHRLRHSVEPGLTGPWQAYGRSQVSYDEMALMDYCYARTKSFLIETRLILRTVLVVITGEGGH